LDATTYRIETAGTVTDTLGQIETWPSETSAVAVFDNRGSLGLHGPQELVQPWASVTKLLTTMCVLIAVEEGTLSLDDHAGPPGSSVRHLLAHASGLAFDRANVLAAPGRRRIYSNLGIELLAETLEIRAQMPFVDYLEQAVLNPLSMSSTTLQGSPAAAAMGSVQDLARFGVELLSPTLISASTMRMATNVVFPGLDGVLPGFGRQSPNDWGLGFELKDSKHPHWTAEHNSPATFGHFGQSGSFIWVDPERNLGCACLCGLAFGPWAVQAWPKLSETVLSVYGQSDPR
jgi:CubicO group peptidase (beta-lactamase class C family)